MPASCKGTKSCLFYGKLKQASVSVAAYSRFNV